MGLLIKIFEANYGYITRDLRGAFANLLAVKLLRDINTWIIVGCVVIGAGALYVKNGGFSYSSNRASGPEDRVVFASSSDAEMQAAYKTAQQTLDGFLKLEQNSPSGAQEFGVKVPISDQNGTEYFWIQPFEYSGSRFSGVVNGEPEVIQSVRFGEKIEFDKSEIVDWKYMRNGRMEGNYTLRVLLKQLPPSEAAQIRKDAGW